ncbi:unnamed protein product, partial [Owenia fusiformis]
GFEGMDAPPPSDEKLYPNIGDSPTPVEEANVNPSMPPVGYMPIDKGGLEEVSVENGDNKKIQSTGDVNLINTQGWYNKKDENSQLYFRDGKRKIDYVIAYKEGSGNSEDKKRERRETFQANLHDEGLELEVEDRKGRGKMSLFRRARKKSESSSDEDDDENSQDGKTIFIKIHAPWDVLARYAELMRIKMPIELNTVVEDTKENDMDIDFTSCFNKCHNPLDWSEDIVPAEPNYFTAPFNRSRENIFIINNKDTFFTNAQRSRMVYEVLLRTKYEPARDKIGIDKLVSNGAYTAHFPLHDGKFTSEHSILTNGAANDRHLLYETWARPGVWYKHQPLDLIRNYFGEKVGIYFAWLGFYTGMLIPASLVGLAVFIYGIATLWENIPSEDICDKSGAGNITMCPLCDKRCYYWKLSTSCLYSRATYLFDNPSTVFFAAFMALWATVFLEFWKRKQAEIEYDWDVADYEFEEHVRPEFEAKVTRTKVNPVTKIEEPYLPFYSKGCRRFTSLLVICFMICLVLAALLGVIVYRIVIVAVFYAQPYRYIQENAKLATTATAACINLIIIMLLNKIYYQVALALTNLERPRTDTEFENSFTIKMFCFQFVNFYATIFYIAFFKGSFYEYPGSDWNYIHLAEEKYMIIQCDPAGCLIELCIQLAIVMVGKQAFNNFKEIMIPKIKNWCSARGAKKAEKQEDNIYTRWERDHDLTASPPMGLFEEYLEMVIQYGFVTIFVAAFPLAPLFALINNIIEIRLDAFKFVCEWRRPPAMKAQDIGIWFGILQGITFIAVITNAFIIAYTSDFIPKMVYRFSPNDGHQDLTGYMRWTLSKFDVNDFENSSRPDPNHDSARSPEFNNTIVTECSYRDFRNPPGIDPKYEHTLTYWYIFAARLAFVIVFEHAIFLLTWVIGYMIPDIPADVHLMMLRENYLAKEAIYTTEKDKSKEERERLKNDVHKQD